MLRLRDISIRNKLILMQVFTSVLVLSIVFSAFIVTDINSYKIRKVDYMISVARVLASNCGATMRFQDVQDAQRLFSELQGVAPEIVHAAIFDTVGNLFASMSRSVSDSLHVPPSLGNKNDLLIGQHLYVSQPIIDHGEELGKIVLDVELSELELIKQDKYKIATILLLVALGVSFLIAFVIQRYISKRLLSLVDRMNELSKTGNYDIPIHDDGKDEISTLITVFNNLMRQVRENQQRKDEFIGIASHELKTPLTSVKGYLELIKMTENKQPPKQYVLKALENANKLERLIRDLLDVSKIQSGQLELDIKEFNIDNLVDETINSFRMISGSHDIIRENNLNGETIMADRHRIEQVLINLLSNAIKYSPGEKKVFVYTTKTETALIIRIRDFGIGIQKQEQANIFERFYRSKDPSRHISGFGLGLYICRDIINRHGGKIWVEAEKQGSSFYISLPLYSYKGQL